jgi:hypothetical protein
MASVNRPTDVKVKEVGSTSSMSFTSSANASQADINRKLQLYGIYSAFANGKVPSVSARRDITSRDPFPLTVM